MKHLYIFGLLILSCNYTHSAAISQDVQNFVHFYTHLPNFRFVIQGYGLREIHQSDGIKKFINQLNHAPYLSTEKLTPEETEFIINTFLRLSSSPNQAPSTPRTPDSHDHLRGPTNLPPLSHSQYIDNPQYPEHPSHKAQQQTPNASITTRQTPDEAQFDSHDSRTANLYPSRRSPKNLKPLQYQDPHSIGVKTQQNQTVPAKNKLPVDAATTRRNARGYPTVGINSDFSYKESAIIALELAQILILENKVTQNFPYLISGMQYPEVKAYCIELIEQIAGKHNIDAQVVSLYQNDQAFINTLTEDIIKMLSLLYPQRGTLNRVVQAARKRNLTHLNWNTLKSILQENTPQQIPFDDNAFQLNQQQQEQVVLQFQRALDAANA